MRNGNLPPGPSYSRVKQAVLWERRYPEFAAESHARYGPTWTAKIGTMATAVVTVDRDAIRALFTGDPLLKRHGNDLLRPVLGDRSLLLLEPREHLARRKLLLPPFHGERVQAYAALMERLVDADLDDWMDADGVEVLPRAQRLTLEVILQAVLGIRDPALRERLRTIYDGMVDTPGSSLGFYFPQLLGRWNPVSRPYWRKKNALDRIVRDQIAATRSDPRLAERDDILALLVQARDEDGNGLTDADLVDELNTLLVAGHETTAAATAWAAEFLAHNPAVLERARHGGPEYLDALVKEVLRIRPPVPVVAARHALGDFTIGGYAIDPEITIIVNAWSIHHDPAIYPDPGRFRPERFLDDPPDSYTFMPFGGGAHRCIGAALAQLEVRIAVKAIVERYDLEPTTETISEPARRGIVLVPRSGGRVRAVRRVSAPLAA